MRDFCLFQNMYVNTYRKLKLQHNSNNTVYLQNDTMYFTVCI